MILLLSLLLSSSPPPIVIKLGTVAPEGSPWQQLLRELNEDWSRRTSGRVTLRVYPGGVLGDETDLVKKLRIGQIHAVALSGSGMEHLEPAVTCLQLPLMFDTYEELDRARDLIAPEIERRLREKGFVVLNWSDAGWVRFFTKRPAFTPQDIQTMKLFTSAADEVTLKNYRAAGFKVVPLATTDMQTALSTGMIDAFDVPPLLALLNQWFPSAPHMLDINWAPVVGATIVTQKIWDKLAPEERDALAASARQLGVSYRARIRQLSEEAVGAMKQRGLTVNHADDRMRGLWRAQAEVAWSRLRDTTCPAPLFDQIKALRGQPLNARAP
ncbi:MAG: TRAP transporter substrate-binding protein DctP [Deltaproteobacteria bacterium]|nr:TRAP transporter substrate-binding protein DctP [Deltaproteobacteria bacterium]